MDKMTYLEQFQNNTQGKEVGGRVKDTRVAVSC